MSDETRRRTVARIYIIARELVIGLRSVLFESFVSVSAIEKEAGLIVGQTNLESVYSGSSVFG
jgi:hypothetical protein